MDATLHNAKQPADPWFDAPQTAQVECDVCEGLGKYPIHNRCGRELYDIRCPECSGSGLVDGPELSRDANGRTIATSDYLNEPHVTLPEALAVRERLHSEAMQAKRRRPYSIARACTQTILAETVFVSRDFGSLGISFVETEPGYSKRECLRDLIAGQHENVHEVYVAEDGRFTNITEDMAIDWLNGSMEHATIGDLEALQANLPKWVSDHVDDAAATIQQAIDGHYETVQHQAMERAGIFSSRYVASYEREDA